MIKKDLAELLASCRRSMPYNRYLTQEARQSVQASRAAIASSIHLIQQSDRLIEQLGLDAEPEPEPAISTQRLPSEDMDDTPGQGDIDGLRMVVEKTFEGEVVTLDGHHFLDCRLIGCTLQYRGQPVILQSTSFQNCTFAFEAEAARTTQMLECFGLILPEHKATYTMAGLAPNSSRFVN